MICPKCAFPNDPGTLVCVKCKAPLKKAPQAKEGSEKAQPGWMAAPQTDPPAPPPPQAPKVASQSPDETEQKSAQAAAAALSKARELQEKGELRAAFVTCQAVLIDRFDRLPRSALADLYRCMARISQAQEKVERAKKYAMKVLSLTEDAEMRSLAEAPKLKVEAKPEPKRSPLKPPLASAPPVVPKAQPAPVKAEPKAEPNTQAAEEPASGEKKAAAVVTAQAASVQGRLVWAAPFWARSLAMGMDMFLVMALVGVMLLFSSAILGESVASGLEWVATSLGNVFTLFGVFMALMFLYVTLFAKYGGQTLGKMLFGLRVIRLDGHGLSWPKSFLRSLGMLLAALPGLAGFLWAAFDLDRRGWHDKLAGTLVVCIQPPRAVLEQAAPDGQGEKAVGEKAAA